MLDAVWLRHHLEEARARLQTRGGSLDADLDAFQACDAERRALLPELERLRAEQKAEGPEVARAKKEGRDATALLERGRRRSDQIRALEARLAAVEAERTAILLRIPNLPHPSVPIGRGPEDNRVVRTWGDPPTFPFPPRAHWELGPALGILDFERAAKIARARFAVLLGPGARLARALIDFMLDLHTREHGYLEVEPPFLVNAASLIGTGNLPKFEADLFKVAGDWDLYLVPTAEVPLANLHRGEILDEARLPLNYTAYTPCFRSEAGSYGADVRGLIRQHQFDKVELFKFTLPEQSYDELERLVVDAEEVLKRLKLPYRTVALCTADLGFASAKTYDLEVWLPAQETYREISSCSNTEAFQARRANIRVRRAASGKIEYLHTLNGSGLAVGRTLVAVLENYQQPDGSVVVPEVLRPYMGGLEAIEPQR
jgi:seryl-tRNA synthetase